jgi:type IV pilus assembly protein PilK
LPVAWSFHKPDSFSEEHMLLWEDLLEKRTGIQLASSQQIFLQAQVASRMRELGIENHHQYLDHVLDDMTGLVEWQILVDRLVVKETAFFRNRPSLELVRQYIREQLNHRSGTVGIWSVGCSTGEEPYSLAAIANDCYQEAGIKPYFGVIGTDVSLSALSTARAGKYGRRSLILLEEEERRKYFYSCGNNHYQIKDNIKKRVCFSQVNILDLKHKPTEFMDVIHCQNVLVYFRRWRRRQILGHLVGHLKPLGILIIGSGEITQWKHERMERIASDKVQAYVKHS